MKKLASTVNMSREEWLDWRRRGIGGSDAAGIVGLSAWSTPFSVYADKLSLIADRDDNEAMRQGRDLEDYVAKRFREETGKRVRRCNAIIVHPEHEFILANVDRIVDGEDSGLECKTMNPRSPAAAMLDDGDVPPQYYVQCQHYMAVTGLSKWYLAILVLGTGFFWFEILRDENDIRALLGAETAFWCNHVLPHIPPAPDGSDVCSDVLKQLYPYAQERKETALPGFDDRLKRLGEIKNREKDLGAERKLIENELKAAMQDAEIGQAYGYRVTLSNRSRSDLDAKAVMAEHPEIDWDIYNKTTTYRVLAVKEVS